MNLYYTWRLFLHFANIKLGSNSGRSLYSFISCILIKKIFVFSSYIEDIETNLPIGKHNLRV